MSSARSKPHPGVTSSCPAGIRQAHEECSSPAAHSRTSPSTHGRGAGSLGTETGAAHGHPTDCAGSGSRPAGSRKAQLCTTDETKPDFLLTHISRVFSRASLVSNMANALSWYSGIFLSSTRLFL